MWDDIIVQLNQDAIKLLNRINEVMRFYKGFNNAMVDDSIMIIENTVQSVNVTLSMLSVETGVFENISNSLNQVYNCTIIIVTLNLKFFSSDKGSLF